MRPSSQPTPIGEIIEDMLDAGFFGDRGRLRLHPDAQAPTLPVLAWAQDVTLDEPKTLIPV